MDILVGLLAIAIGAVFCFRGWLALRIVIPIWGAFAGFFLGAGAVAGVTDEGFLSSVLGWIVGLALALLFGLAAYLYYAIAIVLALAAIGFTVGTDVMVALGVTWSWVIVLVGIALAVRWRWSLCSATCRWWCSSCCPLSRGRVRSSPARCSSSTS